MEKNLTSGSVLKNIVYFSLPYLLSYFLQTLYGMADLFIIGQFEGVAGTTAVSIGSQVMHMLTVMIVGLAMGTTVSIGQAIGANDKRRAANAIGNTVTLFAVVAAGMFAILLLLVNPILQVMSTPQEAVAGTRIYLTICFVGIPFIIAYNVISSIFRGLGDSKSPMYFIAIACVVNIALDYLFMGAFHMGAAGAALGTTLSQAVSVVISLFMIRKKKMGIALKKQNSSGRRFYSDTFWFTLFHEIGHIINGDYGITFENEHAGQEDAADKYAEDKLIPPGEYEAFVRMNEFSENAVRRFAERIDRDPGIVLGRLQNDQIVPFTNVALSKALKHKYKVITS